MFSTENNGFLLLQNNYIVQSHSILHRRHVYDLWNIIGDLGGVFEMTYAIFSFFVWPISEFIFHLRTLKRLFDVKTSNMNIFEEKKSKVHPEKQQQPSLNATPSQHNVSNISQAGLVSDREDPDKR